MQGKLRKKILSECPEEFEGALIDWIDDLEMELKSILEAMDISDISELSNLEEAYSGLRFIVNGLY